MHKRNTRNIILHQAWVVMQFSIQTDLCSPPWYLSNEGSLVDDVDKDDEELVEEREHEK